MYMYMYIFHVTMFHDFQFILFLCTQKSNLSANVRLTKRFEVESSPKIRYTVYATRSGDVIERSYIFRGGSKVFGRRRVLVS